MNSTSGPSLCPPGFRQDDFFNFASNSYDTVQDPCSLNENAQMALFATWLALLGASAVEFAVALYRGLDRSPRLFRLVYAPWLVNGIAISAYVLARPGATVRDQTDAAVLLTLHATGISLAIGLAFAHYVMMLGVLSQALGKFRPNENESKDKLTNYQQSFERIALVGMGASAVICIVLFSIVTNSLGVGSASPEDLELVLTIGWAVQSFCLLAQMLIFSYISWRIRGIIHEQVVFEREVINRIASVDPSATEKKPPSTLAQLENTMIFVSVMGTINALLTCSLFIVAAVLGMQYWIYHVYMAELPMVVIAYLTLYRSRGILTSFLPYRAATDSSSFSGYTGSARSPGNNQSPNLKAHGYVSTNTTTTGGGGGGAGADDVVELGNLSIRIGTAGEDVVIHKSND